MLRWVFFDVGNVILNDDPNLANAYIRLYEALKEKGYEITFSEMMEERFKIMKGMEIEQTGPYFNILGEKLLGKEEYSSVFIELAEEMFPKWGENIELELG